MVCPANSTAFGCSGFASIPAEHRDASLEYPCSSFFFLIHYVCSRVNFLLRLATDLDF